MTETVRALVVDLLEWLSARDRTYAETMEAWRTSCPALTVWEEANEHGLLAIDTKNEQFVRVTAAGYDFLAKYRRVSRNGMTL